MQTYTKIKNGTRKLELQNRKEGVKQIDNFYNIVTNMNILSDLIENYNGIITESNLTSICNLINREKQLSLTEDQIKLVTKQYGSEKN